MREFIDKEIMKQEYRGILNCEIDTEYKHVSDDNFCEKTVKNLIEDANTYSEQEIVRPYLTKLRSDIVASIEDIKGKYDNTVPTHDKPFCKCVRNEARLEIIEWIDGLLAELGET